MPASHKVDQPGGLVAFLFASHPEAKRTTVRQWLKHGSVQVNGQTVTRSNHALEIGDVVDIRDKADVVAEDALPPGMKIWHEDPSLVVVDKPEHLLSVATTIERSETAYAYLIRYLRTRNPKGRERVWIVHRLDREASGLMVFAKTEDAKRALQRGWDKFEKRYLAVVEGHPPSDKGVFRSNLDESSPAKVYSARESEKTRHAVTRYRVLKKNQVRALVELTLETGRRNQIRVHLADAECPIVGDRKYEAKTNPARRLGLHASSLQFEHPTSGEALKFESPLPKSLARLVPRYGKARP